MKKLFKPGERVNVRGVSDEIKNAIIARFEADGWEPYYNVAGYIGIYGESFLSVRTITIEDCLFRGAPTWAVDVRYNGVNYGWTNGENNAMMFDGNIYQHKSLTDNIILLQTRKPVETEKPWHETGALPPVGEVVQMSFGKAVVNFLNQKLGQICVTDLESGISYLVNKSQISPIQKTKKIDMSKFAGTDVLLRRIKGDCKLLKASELDVTKGIYAEDYLPEYNVWNHWTGDSEPEWLEGFRYEVKAYNKLTGRVEIFKYWPHLDRFLVHAFKILRIKDGWELQ